MLNNFHLYCIFCNYLQWLFSLFTNWFWYYYWC